MNPNEFDSRDLLSPNRVITFLAGEQWIMKVLINNKTKESVLFENDAGAGAAQVQNYAHMLHNTIIRYIQKNKTFEEVTILLSQIIKEIKLLKRGYGLLSAEVHEFILNKYIEVGGPKAKH